MYDHILGVIHSKQPTSLILRCQGVGYHLNISFQTYDNSPDIGQECLVYTFLHVREDILNLFGFLDQNERLFFTKLISINGIGPMTALRIMSGSPFSQLVESVKMGNVTALNKIKGVGKKTAERIILELSSALNDVQIDSNSDLPYNIHQDALAALQTLGYNEKESSKAIKSVMSTKDQIAIDELIREVLKII
ncbi:MAG: Holliday junction branch migration protein RuvA [Planctomycetota bacterium]|nr:MAG: Holliday junction branch migration protein RuvA [Planctomycetota bacterium]